MGGVHDAVVQRVWGLGGFGAGHPALWVLQERGRCVLTRRAGRHGRWLNGNNEAVCGINSDRSLHTCVQRAFACAPPGSRSSVLRVAVTVPNVNQTWP